MMNKWNYIFILNVIWFIYLFFQVLVEFDGKSWEKREWIKIYEIYQIFLVEYTVVLVPREVPNKSPYQVNWPALVSKVFFCDLNNIHVLTSSGENEVEIYIYSW